MTRRFLTAEDVRGSGETEILVEVGTIVTPQALEAAESAGIAIRTPEGAWSEPEPDRGPDSERANVGHPALPEPEESAELHSTAVVTAVGRNRGGVLAEITATIADLGGNVYDVSQKVFEGFFHIILTVELSDRSSFDAFKTALEGMGSPDDFIVRVMNERVFRFMHRV